MKKPVKKKLYACATAWHWDAAPESAYPISLYASADACLDGEACTEECGVVELEVVRGKVVVPGRPVRLGTLVEDRDRRQREFLSLMRASERLSDEVLAFLGRKRSLAVREAALRQALSAVEGKLRARRKRARLSK